MDFGDSECCGCLDAIFRGYDADITCNECGVVVRTVPVTDLERTLDGMELTLNVSSEMCPKCGRVNLFPGFSRMLVYICQGCGESISVPDGAYTGEE
jgi:RNase P subunit RPR2